MATLLSMAKAVARDLASYDVKPPSTIVNNSDPTAAALLRQATKAARRIYKDHDWTILQREHTFQAASGTAEYALPSDFGRFIGDTAWDRDAFEEMRGPLTPQQWQIAKSGIVQTVSIDKQWRVKRAAASVANRFVIDPTPDDTNDLVFEYVSNSWATAANGSTLRTDWVADDDIPIIDPDLIELDMTWRMLERLGQDATTARIEADREIDRAWARDGGAPVLSLTIPPFRAPPFNLPSTGWGS